MFRRSKSDPTPEPTSADLGADARPGGKGRPTPTRREAEAAARARAKTPRTRKEIAAYNRQRRGDASAKMREAMKTGDDKYLPTRDRGPLRRFTRDFVDHRLMFLELLIPVLLVTMILGYSGNTRLAAIANSLMFGCLLLAFVDGFVLWRRLKREVGRRFAGESTKGLTYYAIMRAMQPRFLRLPKPQVKLGQQLPEQYR